MREAHAGGRDGVNVDFADLQGETQASDILPVGKEARAMDEATGRGPEPGDVGMTPKTISIPVKDLDEYRDLVRVGVLNMNLPSFVRQAVAHELARYRAEYREKKRRQ